MSVIREIFLQCDFCSETLPDSRASNVALLRIQTARTGWKRIEEKDKCPFCVEKEKGKKP